jgi:hypothetical protein
LTGSLKSSRTFLDLSGVVALGLFHGGSNNVDRIQRKYR